MKKKLIWLVLAFAMVFFVSCENDSKKIEEKNSTKKETMQTKESEEKYINTYLPADPTSLDAQKNGDAYGGEILMNIVEPLVRIDVDENGDTVIVNAGAKEVKESEDGKVYTFILRDYTWDDGKPVTAQDFVYGIRRTVDPNTGSESNFLLAPLKNYEQVSKGELPLEELGVKAIDDKTLEITLENPTSYFYSVISSRVMYPQRQDIVKQFGENFGSESDQVIGCGPYKITDWVHNSSITLEKNENYWDKDNIKIDKINYAIVGDTNTLMNLFQTGEVDAVNTTLKEWTEQFDKLKGVDQTKVAFASVDFLTVNTKDKLVSNPKVRLAVQVALDRNKLNEQVYSGTNQPAVGYVPPIIQSGDKSYREQAGNTLEPLQKANPDPKKLMQEGLKELGMDTDLSKVTLNLQLVNSPLLKSTAEFMQANLKESLGVNVEIELMEWPVLNNNITSGNYQFAYMAWGAYFNDPYDLMSIFLPDGAVNTGWKNEEFTTTLTNAVKEIDPKKQVEDYKKAEEILLEEAPVIPILTVETTYYNYDYLKNYRPQVFSTMGWRDVDVEGRQK